MVGVVVRRDDEIESVDMRPAQPLGYRARCRPGVDEDCLVVGSADEGGVTLSNIKELNGELRIGRVRQQAQTG